MIDKMKPTWIECPRCKTKHEVIPELSEFFVCTDCKSRLHIEIVPGDESC